MSSNLIAMKTRLFPWPNPAQTLALVAISAFTSAAMAEDTDILPTIPTISIRAFAPETREPFCDPAICDAALPAPGVFVITRRGGELAGELAVFLSYHGSASNGVDYSALPQSVIFPAGAASVQLFVEAKYDKLAEGDEVAVAQLEPDPSLGPIERYRVDPELARARVLIHDNEAPVTPVVSIVATSPIAEESSYPLRRLPLRGQFTISRTGPVELSLNVFVIYRGTATPDVDYPALPWLVTIPAGTNQVELEVAPKPDELAEPIEIIEAQLSPCPPLTDPPLGMPCYNAPIDPAHSTARVYLRDDGITTASLEITSPADGSEFRLGQTIPIAATAIDLEGAITHVTFHDGEHEIGSSTIFFFREPDPGTPIHHQFDWTTAGAGPHVLTARAQDANSNKVISAPVRLTVGQGLPVVSIEATVPETIEPSPTTRVAPGVFTLRRTGDPTNRLNVWVYFGGTARMGLDYAMTPNVVEFPAGSSEAVVRIAPLDDLIAEGDETVIAELGPSPLAVVPGYQFNPEKSRAQVVIHDNDTATIPVVGIRATQPVTSEPCLTCLVAPGVFTIHRIGPTNDPLTVWYLLGGTARNGEDYQRLSGEAVIPAGRESVNVLVLGLLDNLTEGDETVVAGLITPPVAGLVEPYRINPENARATVIIRDFPFTPPTPVVSIAAVDGFAREGTNRLGGRDPALLVVGRSGPTNESIEVHFELSGTASNGVDYVTISSPVVIPAGQRRAVVPIRPLDDLLSEGYETVIATLLPDDASSPTYTVGVPRRAAAIIADNDLPRPGCIRLSDGLFNLCVRLQTDMATCFRVEVSRDLKDWSSLCTLPQIEGEAHFVDPDAVELPHRFYRVVPVPCDP